jgi:murein DD-endopeptidase MepM/ murein hydrolase activator NlpD
MIPMFESPTYSLRVRRQDKFGSGFYLAARTTDGRRRLHMGLDLECSVGQSIIAPCDGEVTAVWLAYPGDPRYHSIHIRPTAEPLIDVKLLYVACSLKAGTPVLRKQLIGNSENLQPRYPGITQHCHIEIHFDGEPVNPALYLECTVPQGGLLA